MNHEDEEATQLFLSSVDSLTNLDPTSLADVAAMVSQVKQNVQQSNILYFKTTPSNFVL